MKVSIDRDEWYPMFSLHRKDSNMYKYGIPVEITEEFYEHYQRVLYEFTELQEELEELEKENT